MSGILLPQYVKKILKRIENSGYEGFVVGGALRDAILGRECNDYDIATSALPQETEHIFHDKQTIPTGMKHGTVTVLWEGHAVEITTYRIDGEYKDSRHPKEVTFAPTIYEDLARRDFTVNAMAYNETSMLVDPYGGRNDIEKRHLRAVGEPEKRFNEDALRILRAFRFCSKLGFDIEKKTLYAAVKCRYGLANISSERIASELEGILLGEYVKKALELMLENDIFSALHDGFCIEKARIDSVCQLPCDFACRMAFCLVFNPCAGEFLRFLKLSNKLYNRILTFVKMTEECPFVESEYGIRVALSRLGGDVDSFEQLMDMCSLIWKKDMSQAKASARKIYDRGDCLSIGGLKINGADLVSLGIKGKAVGETLNILLDAVLRDPATNTRDLLLSLASPPMDT